MCVQNTRDEWDESDSGGAIVELCIPAERVEDVERFLASVFTHAESGCGDGSLDQSSQDSDDPEPRRGRVA